MPVIAWIWIVFLGSIAVLATAGYWLLPLWYWVRPARVTARPPALAQVRTRSLLPHSMEAALVQHEAPLTRLGFSALVPVRDARDATKIRGGTSGVIQLWRHAEDGTVAAVMVSPTGPASALSVLSLTTRLADGTTVETTNMPVASVFPPLSDLRRARFRAERVPKRLLALHRARVAELGRPDPESIEDPVAFQSAREQRALDWFVASRYMRRSGDRLRHTLRGAFLGTWRQMAPWKWVDAWRNERERRRLAVLAGIERRHGNERSLSSRLLFE